MGKLIKLHPLDNVFIVVEEWLPGENIQLGDLLIPTAFVIGIGHKIAGRQIEAGEKIIKYGVPIGSATVKVEVGAHLHLHNMKSDYLPTYTIDGAFKENDK